MSPTDLIISWLVVTHERTELVLHPFHGPGLAEALAGIPGASLITPPSAEEVAAVIEAGAQALVTFDWDDAFLGSDLRWVQAISAGVDHFPIESLAESGVVLTSARGAHTPAVAEHAVALLFALTRGLGPAMRRAVRHEWKPELGTEVNGMTVCVLGFGSIGSEIARMLEALNAKVIGVRRNPEPSPFAECVVGPERLLEACTSADVLICALPHAPETTSMVGDAELEALGRGWVVNVGRGSTIDESALLRALDEGDLEGAALDVAAVEPLPTDSPFWDREDVVITPHMAWATDRLNPRLVNLVSANLAAYRGEAAWRNRVV